MHAIYTFLLDGDETPETIGTIFEESFSYYLDENNWYTLLVILNQEGDIINLADKDYRNSHKFVNTIYEVAPDKKKRWNWGLDFSNQCIVSEINFDWDDPIVETGNAVQHEDLTNNILTSVPKHLSKQYGEIDFTKVKQYCRSNYNRSRVSAIFEKFIKSNIKPFGECSTPYEYRCFDLRKETWGPELTPENTMLFVDIHF